MRFQRNEEEVTEFFRLFERPNCVLLLLTSTDSTIEEEEVESGGEEKKTRKQVVIAASRAAVSIVRGARLVSNLSRREARRKLTDVEGDRRFSIGALNRRYCSRGCFSISIVSFSRKIKG